MKMISISFNTISVAVGKVLQKSNSEATERIEFSLKYRAVAPGFFSDFTVSTVFPVRSGHDTLERKHKTSYASQWYHIC